MSKLAGLPALVMAEEEAIKIEQEKRQQKSETGGSSSE
jgi:hypothetical protein